jgi:predicted ArsR family transcriptional regulator
MARPRAKTDLLSKLAEAGEDALSRLSKAPGMDQVASFAQTTRDRLDELTRRVRGIEQLEEKLKKLEQRVDELSGTKPRRSTTASRKKTSAARKRSSTSR